MGLILEHLLSSFFWNVSYGLWKNYVRKRRPPNSWTLENVFLRSRSFLSCASRKSVLKLKARPRAPEFAPYKGTQKQWRGQSESTQLRKQLGKQQERNLCPSEKQPVHRWAREDQTSPVQRLKWCCKGYKPSPKNEAWGYITREVNVVSGQRIIILIRGCL